MDPFTLDAPFKSARGWSCFPHNTVVGPVSPYVSKNGKRGNPSFSGKSYYFLKERSNQSITSASEGSVPYLYFVCEENHSDLWHFAGMEP